MSYLRYLASLVVVCLSFASGTTFTITASGFTFTPNTLTVVSGDTVKFTLETMHDAVEVSQNTWNAGGSTPLSGGFSVGFGGGKVILTQVGTHYFVCQPHAGFGMKGIITVNPFSPTGVKDVKGTPVQFALLQNYPNPFNPSTSIRYSLPVESRVVLKVFNLLGQETATLVDGVQSSGIKGISFSPAGSASGVYFVRLDAVPVADPTRSFSEVRKIVLQK